MRLGDIDAVKDKLLHDSFCSWHDFNTVINALNEAPTVDAVPVVRCKDCKYFIQTVFFGNKMNACRLHGSSTILPTARIIADDWFCADGEKVSE